MNIRMSFEEIRALALKTLFLHEQGFQDLWVFYDDGGLNVTPFSDVVEGKVYSKLKTGYTLRSALDIACVDVQNQMLAR